MRLRKTYADRWIDTMMDCLYIMVAMNDDDCPVDFEDAVLMRHYGLI